MYHSYRKRYLSEARKYRTPLKDRIGDYDNEKEYRDRRTADIDSSKSWYTLAQQGKWFDDKDVKRIVSSRCFDLLEKYLLEFWAETWEPYIKGDTYNLDMKIYSTYSYGEVPSGLTRAINRFLSGISDYYGCNVSLDDDLVLTFSVGSSIEDDVADELGEKYSRREFCTYLLNSIIEPAFEEIAKVLKKFKSQLNDSEYGARD